MEGSEASVRDYYYQRAPFFPSSSASFTSVTRFEDIGRNARMEEKKGGLGEGAETEGKAEQGR